MNIRVYPWMTRSENPYEFVRNSDKRWVAIVYQSSMRTLWMARVIPPNEETSSFGLGDFETVEEAQDASDAALKELGYILVSPKLLVMI